MRLFIAEKPAMAAELARCLPGPVCRKDGYIETAAGLVTWSYGHILRLAEPDEYDAKYGKWDAAHLPVIPPAWKLLVSESGARQFQVIKELVSSASEIVHAGDPDREGQLLIDEILDYVGNKKPVLRVLLNALDEASIKSALAALRANGEFLPLKLSALARQRADWLVGMNCSRAFTLAARQSGHRQTFPVGRVKTPALALVVRREREIAAFTPVEYFTFKVDFEHNAGRFTAVWKAAEDTPGLDAEGRLVDRSVAAGLKRKLAAGGGAVVTAFDTVEKKVPQPLPFSLSALQIEAGRRFGYSPQAVLDAAQSLYEKKLASYPRSDCEYLPLNQFALAAGIMSNLMACDCAELAAWAAKADVRLESRAWNDAKISSHHAIIPTGVRCESARLTEAERDVYWLIARSYIAQFYPVHVFDQSTVAVAYAGESFRVGGRVVRATGWKELFTEAEEAEPGAEEEDRGCLPVMKTGDAVSFVSLQALKKSTKPPARFTESSLLQAMKEIHNYVKEDELKKRLKSVSGIGTEATRAGIIEDLLRRQFLVKEKKRLVPAESAFVLIDALPDELTFPDTTALWEERLREMDSEKKLNGFLVEQCIWLKELCASAASVSVVARQETSFSCPKCGVGVLRLRRSGSGVFWGCSEYKSGCKASFEDRQGKPEIVEYPCPVCQQGRLKRRKGIRGPFWGCSQHPACTAVFEDSKGTPRFTAAKKGKGGAAWQRSGRQKR